MGTVLLFNIEAKKAIAIKNLCRKLYLDYREIAQEDFGRTLGFLLGFTDEDASKTEADFEEEMLYFSAFSI